MDMGTTSGSFVTTTTPGAVLATFSSRITDHILRAGLNYRFMLSRLQPIELTTLQLQPRPSRPGLLLSQRSFGTSVGPSST